MFEQPAIHEHAPHACRVVECCRLELGRNVREALSVEQVVGGEHEVELGDDRVDQNRRRLLGVVAEQQCPVRLRPTIDEEAGEGVLAAAESPHECRRVSEVGRGETAEGERRRALGRPLVLPAAEVVTETVVV